MTTEQIKTQCCIVGGGPAGMLLGHILARAGIDVVVLEKHPDFFRDFRGDTIHAQSLEILHQLGLDEDLLRLPHEKVPYLHNIIESEDMVLADYTHLKVRHPFMAVFPQWDFLAFLKSKSIGYPTFHLRMPAAVNKLVCEDNRVAGVYAETPEGTLMVRADLVVGCDGRDSTVRSLAGLTNREFGAAIDVMWWRMPRFPEDNTATTLGFNTSATLQVGGAYVRVVRPDHHQCGYFVSKHAAADMRSGPIELFRREVAELDPVFADRVETLQSWDDVPLLTVRTSRLKRWFCPGLLCIGDAAHAMSPTGGVGVNYALQDSVAAANLLVEPLRRGVPTVADLRKVQRRRNPPTAVTQLIQRIVQDHGLGPVMEGKRRGLPKSSLALLRRRWLLPRITGRMEGLGIRRENVRVNFGDEGPRGASPSTAASS